MSWESAITEILSEPGVVLVIGGIDVGKTYFVRMLANAGVDAGVPTAVVDADVGQSEVGPPTVVSMAIVENKVDSLRELKPRRMYFVGSTSPVGRLLPVVVGTKRMVEESISRGAQLVVVDTSGLVAGALGRRLKMYKTDLIRPSHIAAIYRKHEIDTIISFLSKQDNHKLYRLSAPADAKSKSIEFRAARRRSQFYEYFKNAETHRIRLDDVGFRGTLFGTGLRISWRNFRTIERVIGARVLHAEVASGAAYVVADCRPQGLDIKELADRYGAREYYLVCHKDFINVLVALCDADGEVIDLGIIEKIDFDQRHMYVITPALTVSPVRLVEFGAMRILRDGTELGHIRFGEI